MFVVSDGDRRGPDRRSDDRAPRDDRRHDDRAGSEADEDRRRPSSRGASPKPPKKIEDKPPVRYSLA